MRELARWSARRVIWACVLWLLGAPVIGAIGLVLALAVLAAISGKQAISVSVNMTNLSAGWVLGPPLILIVAWMFARNRRPRSPDDAGSDA